MFFAYINWGTVPDWVGATLTAISIIVAAKIGLRAWKSELKGATQYKLAVRIMKNVYGMRNTLVNIRSPFLSSREAGKDAGENWIAKAYQNRWDLLNKVDESLRTDILEAEVYWGKSIKNLYEELKSHVNKLYSANILFIESENDKAMRNEFYKRKQDVILYARPNDDYDKQLSRIIKKFENKIEPYLEKGKG